MGTLILKSKQRNNHYYVLEPVVRNKMSTRSAFSNITNHARNQISGKRTTRAAVIVSKSLANQKAATKKVAEKENVIASLRDGKKPLPRQTRVAGRRLSKPVPVKDDFQTQPMDLEGAGVTSVTKENVTSGLVLALAYCVVCVLM